MKETPPKRRALQLRNTGLRDLARHFTEAAPEMELGWSAAIEELRHSGWPARTPDGDRRPSLNPPEPSVIDYLDPTGDGAGHLAALHDDVQAMQDHRHVIETSLRAIQLLSKRHRPTDTSGIPVCEHCDNPVESRQGSGKTSYVGMECIGGVWVAKSGNKPACRKHRAQRERDAA